MVQFGFLSACGLFDLFKVPVVLFVRHLVILESFKIVDNFKPWYASGRNYEILLTWHTLRRTNSIEINYWTKIANKTANINVQNRSLYAS